MKIALCFSSKQGLLKEFEKRNKISFSPEDIPEDYFAEGDSPETIEAIAEAIQAGGHQVVKIEADNSAAEKLEKNNPDLVFNVAEGLYGNFRESYIPMICERLNLPYTGSDPLALAICLNKARAKEILSYHSLPTPGFKVIKQHENYDIQNFTYPAIIKPIAEGSSKGIYNDSVVSDPEMAMARIKENFQKYNESLILEKFLEGAEFTVAVWGNGIDAEVLPIISINYEDLPKEANPIYSYEAKWIWDRPEKPLDIFHCPAQLSFLQQRNICDVALNAYHALNIRDWCRIDIRMDEQEIPHILELNPLPGILPKPEDNSCFPKAARTKGYSYEEMINHVISFASKRYGLKL